MNIDISISAAVSFSIAWLGWAKLEKRAEKMATRSESFSLLTPTISLLNEFRLMAENSLHASSSSSADSSFEEINQNDIFYSKFRSPRIRAHFPAHKKDKKNPESLIKKQSFDMKFHSKYQLLTSKLKQLDARGIKTPNNLLINLRIAFTDNTIDSLPKYHKALMATDQIESELYIGFERAYKK